MFFINIIIVNRLFLFTFYCQHLTVDKKRRKNKSKTKNENTVIIEFI
jgi:hypothetical protein